MVKDLIDESTFDPIKSCSSLVKFVLVVFVPIFAFKFLRTNFEQLNSGPFVQKYGTLYDNIVISPNHPLAINFVPNFALRRFVLAFSTVFFQDLLFLQLIMFIYTTLYVHGFTASV